MTPHRWQIAFLQNGPVQPKERDSEGDAWEAGVAVKREARRLLKFLGKHNARLRKERSEKARRGSP